MEEPEFPPANTYQRFATAWLRAALGRCGSVATDVSLWTEAHSLVVWEPRSSENDYTPPLADDPDDPLGERMARELLGAAMEAVGSVPVQHEVESMELRVNLRCETDTRRRALGLLGRLAGPASAWELLHDPMAPNDIESCLHKQLNLLRDLEDRPARLPRFWVILPEHDDTVVSGWGMRPDKHMTSSVFWGPPAHALGVVMLDRLPRTRATLGLRMLGLGDVLRDATDDLRALPKRAWERAVTRAALDEALGPHASPEVIAMEPAPLRALRSTYHALHEALTAAETVRSPPAG